jgi:Spy/CpxP family protein refolding chaperone
MKNLMVLIVLCFFVVLGADFCLAQENAGKAALPAAVDKASVNGDTALELARMFVDFHRQGVILANLELTPEESQKFWPVYDDYQRALEPLRNRAVNVIIAYNQKYDTIDGKEARDMLKELLDVQQDEIAVRRKFMPQFEAALPIKKVVRFYQIDNKINSEVRYKISQEIPLLVATPQEESPAMAQ